MTSLAPKLTTICASATLAFASVALLPPMGPASAADVEIGGGGVDIDAGNDRYDRYDQTHDRYGEFEDEETDRYSDRYDRREDDDVNIDVPGADIHVD